MRVPGIAVIARDHSQFLQPHHGEIKLYGLDERLVNFMDISVVIYCKCRVTTMQDQSSSFKLLFWTSLLLALHFSHGTGKEDTTRCQKNAPSINQTRVDKAKFRVDVINNCGTCPVIDIHVKCGKFPQKLVDAKLFKVLKVDDCVVNNGFPLPPLQTVSFNYSHATKYPLSPSFWYFQCE